MDQLLAAFAFSKFEEIFLSTCNCHRWQPLPAFTFKSQLTSLGKDKQKLQEQQQSWNSRNKSYSDYLIL